MPKMPQCGFVHICFINHPAPVHFILILSHISLEITPIFGYHYSGTLDKTLIMYRNVRSYQDYVAKNGHPIIWD